MESDSDNLNRNPPDNPMFLEQTTDQVHVSVGEDRTEAKEPDDDAVNVSIESIEPHVTELRAEDIKVIPDAPESKQDGCLSQLDNVCKKLAEDQTLDQHDKTADSILQLLVTEDMSSINSPQVLTSLFVDYLHLLPPKIISEVLSVLIAIVKKSVFHLELARGLLIPCVGHYLLSEVPKDSSEENQSLNPNVSLTKHFLREWINLLIDHSCDVEELESILKFSENDPTLLSSLQQANLKQRNRPTAYFAFPGARGSMISLPPFQKWPIQLGWSFSTWFFLEPKACEQPYLYNFKTGKSGLGYSAHFTGNCLVLTSIRVKGKGVQHCVAYEFPSYKWIHCAITYHNKWRASEIKVYVNGQLSANIEMPWQVQTTEIFDKCFIGGSGTISNNDRFGEMNCFCGQISAVYLFSEGLSPTQICAIHRAGPSYMGQFKYSNEGHVNIPHQISKVLYEEKLASSLFCLYTPVAVASGTLCIQLAPLKSSTTVSAQNYFISAPHAALLGRTIAIITQPVCSTLQSLGCSRSLLPLLDVFARKGDSGACSILIGFLCDLLESSPHWFAIEMVQNNGFVVVACALATNARMLMNEKLLDIFLNLTRTLLTNTSSAGDSMLLKHLMDNILFNPTLWVYADTKLQIKLYSYLASEILHGSRTINNKYTLGNSSSHPSNPNSILGGTNINSQTEPQSKAGTYESAVTDILFGEIRRVSTVLQSLHALKYYYWMVEEKGINPKARNHKLRPNNEDLKVIRSHILLFIRELIIRSNTSPLDEIQGLLNYLSACTNEENLLDVMDTLSTLLKEHPFAIGSALDQKQGIKVLFTLIGSQSEKVRVQALKILALFLARCTPKKKQDIMGPCNLFMLLSDQLKVYPLSLEVYQALMAIMLETDEITDANKGSNELSSKRIENSVIIKVIASLLRDKCQISKTKPEDSARQNKSPAISIKNMFINSLWNLIVNSRENRRIILQMSVWQHWLINLIGCTLDESQLVRDQVLAIFRVLLYHAIRYEYGGWRVWIDTLAIIHTKVSYDEFYRQLSADSPAFTAHNIDTHSKQKTQTLKTKTITPEVETTENDNKACDDDSGDESNFETSDENQRVIVSSISERIPRESSGIQMESDRGDKVDSAMTEQLNNVTLSNDPSETDQLHKHEESIDSVDLAPSRAYRKQSLKNSDDPEAASADVEKVDEHETGEVTENSEITRQQSLMSISLDEPNVDRVNSPDDSSEVKEQEDPQNSRILANDYVQPQKVTASPAFRIPEFRWSTILTKLLNDLMFSIECDLYNWRSSSKCSNLDAAPFVPKSSSSNPNQGAANPVNNHAASRPTNASTINIETILQKAENQIYIINIIHFISQLADNIIIASGGLLPLLADATGGSRNNTATESNGDSARTAIVSEGLTMSQANSLLYRLINMVDVVIFAASHINLNELEADKSTTNGGILRQCLRLACTVTVKNCLVVRSLHNKIASMGIGGGYNVSISEFPKDMFDSYQGCSLLSANGLFENSALLLENSDLIANIEFSPHQTPNTSSMPSLLPFQSTPIKDPNKLLQNIDISRMQACIYHDLSTESRQSQFLALSSLYFISVLMVSKYRDIIEPKQKIPKGKPSREQDSPGQSSGQSLDSGIQNGGSVSSIESNLLNFGKMQPNSGQSTVSGSTNNALTDMLTTKLENTLDTVCPLLKSIMCDFCSFLSKTLIGSHGQDLVNKEADRTFRRANTSPVELVMLLCSQEWQNTLQKNAGLAFIELINEGRVLSHGMKDHIVRVAMEAEFILSRLRADDVAKHEHFTVSCGETQSARLHEEVLINSLINSATRRDYVVYCKFQETVQIQGQRKFKLDVWEDDDRRKRRFIIDSWDDEYQSFYSTSSIANTSSDGNDKNDTKRILDLQQSIELGGVDDHCSPAGTGSHPDNERSSSIVVDKDDDCEEGEYEEDDDDQPHNDSHSIDSDVDHPNKGNLTKKLNMEDVEPAKSKQAHSVYNPSSLNKSFKEIDFHESDMRNSQAWDYEDCSSVNEFTGAVVFAAECSLVWNVYAIPGVFQLTSQELYFEPNQNISESIDALKNDFLENHEQDEDKAASKSNPEQVILRKLDLKVLRYCDFLACNGKILLQDIRAIFSRHYLLQPHALEIFLAQRTSVMFAFSDFDTVKRAVKYLPPVGVGIKYGIPQTRRASLMAPRQLFSASNMMQKWQKREIGNFQYLMFLNTIAGRTYQDLNQYPVFPWILTNYESEELDLNLPSNFRDLSKPVGALNSKRRAEFMDRYSSWDNPKVPAFHYGTHYSTAAFTLNWLCRLRGSHNSAYLTLHDGKYEEDTRLFLSIGDSWVSSLIGGQQNVKELIPEFFYLPEMFHSSLGLPEVEYPPWAKTGEEFVRKHRLALESELVSCQLHQWIDLIFGYKQRGLEAINSVNTFYYLTYQGNVNLNMIQDSSLRDAIETQIKHFGQTPSQLTTEPHPPRFSALHVSPLVFSSTIEEVNKVVKFPYNTPIVHIAPCISNYIVSTSSLGDNSSNNGSNKTKYLSSILTLTSNNQYQINNWIPSDQSGHSFTIELQIDQTSSTRRQLVDIDDLCSGISLKLNSYESKQDVMNEIHWPCAHYVVTIDGRYIIMGSFYDNSFRVFTTESGKLCQVIYGHRAPITCIARSEGNAGADFYIATGSQDCSLLLWTWNEKYAQVEGSGVSAVHNPLPKLTISGHQTPVLCVSICSELGLIISGSRSLILVHTTAFGENLLEINVQLPNLFRRTTTETSVEGVIQRPLVADKEKTILEASMLGDANQTYNKPKVRNDPEIRTPSPGTNVANRFSHLKDLFYSDYYINNLQLARELGFIVCVALPPPKRKSKVSDDAKNINALLMTFNLQGSLIEATTIGQARDGPRLGDVCMLQTTRDGEHLILNDSSTTLKLYRTFDLQLIYTYNTNDLPKTIGEDQNRVRSLALLDQKYILVGLENGKVVVYNAQMKNLQ